MTDQRSNEIVGADPLLTELFEELTNKLQAGEPVDVEDYVRRYPHCAEAIGRFLPAIQVLIDLGQSIASAPGPGTAFSEQVVAGLLGDFRIVREIGRGGMGVVYEAEQVSLGRRVALKVLPYAAMLDQRHLSRFKIEAQAAAQLHHPNIVPVYAVGCERGIHYYAMQYLEGQTLAQMIADLRHEPGLEDVSQSPDPNAAASLHPPTAATTRLEPQAAATTQRLSPPNRLRALVEHVRQVAEALDYAHAEGIVHRDIKPSNLVLDARGKVWITDFGLARFDAGVTLTATGDVVGTLRYMSPEQAFGHRGGVDHRTDIYALGATLYELLSLEPVFSGADRQTLLRRIAQEEPRSLRQVNRDVPAEIVTIVHKALAKDAHARYATAQELADDLRRFLEHKPIQARPPTLVDQTRKWCRRHEPWVWSVGGMSLLATIVLVAGTVWHDRMLQAQVRQVEQERQRAEANFRQARQAIESFTSISEGTLLDVPGSQTLRMELLETALRYHRKFLEQRSEDPFVQAELAASYFRLSQIYGAIDRSDEGIEALGRGIDLAEALAGNHPGRRELVEPLAGLYKAGRDLHLSMRLPSDLPKAFATLLRAVALLERLVRDHPGIAGFQNDLAGFYMRLADYQRSIAQHSEAMESTRKASTIWEALVRQQPISPEYRSNLGDGYFLFAKTLEIANERVEADRYFRKALELAEQVAADFPDRAEYQSTLANRYTQLGRLLQAAEQPALAEQTYRRALAVQTKLAADFPAVPIYQEALGVCQFDLANTLNWSDRTQLAEVFYNQALIVFERLADAYPTMAGYRERLASYYRSLSLLLKDSGRTDEELKAHRRAVEVRESLVADFPAAHRYHEQLAWLLLTGSSRDERDVSRAMELSQKAVELAPEDSYDWAALGAACYRRGNYDAAFMALDKSAKLGHRGSGGAFYLAMTHWRLGQQAEAHESHREAIRRLENRKRREGEFKSLRLESAVLIGITDEAARPSAPALPTDAVK